MGIVCILLAAGIFLGDLWVKNRVEKNVAEGKIRQLWGGRLLLRRYHNRGAMLNLGEKRRALVAAVSVVMTAAVTVLFCLSLGTRGNSLLRVGLTFLLGGAFSNTYDRLKRKYVVDYFSIGVGRSRLRRIVFNISDLFILIGALLAVVASLD